jgi:hypothetical protein
MIYITAIALIILYALSKAKKIQLSRRVEHITFTLIVILVLVPIVMVLLSIPTGTGVDSINGHISGTIE